MNDRLKTARRVAVAPRSTAGLLFVIALLAMLPLEFGCPRSSPSPRPAGPGERETDRLQRREILDVVIRSFSNYEENDSLEVLQQAIGRLDQWARTQEPLADWRLDPMVAALPEPYAELFKVLKLDQLEFHNSDVFAFREAFWLRDVSRWARGDAVDELDQARALFDWTVRNVQLDWTGPGNASGAPGRILQKPWETLLLGRGTAMDRAWLFILLARQQGIDAALLALIETDDPSETQIRPWVVSVLSQGELYLFEPTLGVPIPAPDGITHGPAGALDLRPATLAQVAADDALLRQLDFGEYSYPVKSAQVERVAVLLEASPAYLAQRMELVESQLAGGDTLTLATDPTSQAKGFQACRHVAEVRLWPLPYQTLIQELQLGPNRQQWQQAQLIPFMARMGPFPALWKGRQYHFKGIFSGEQSATTFYQSARPPERLLNDGRMEPAIRKALVRAKTDASYWLGLIAAGQGHREAAIDWLSTRTLEATPDGPWTSGARYNLGRTYEADGQIAKAIETYRSDNGSPVRHGNLLRAHWLQPPAAPPANNDAAAKTEDAPKSDAPAPDAAE
ncbi:MAG: hypothetical protein ABIK89_17045 [Planctomycetota bacterium]